MIENAESPITGGGGLPNSNLNFELGTIWTRDNLDVMKGMNSETVDLIYLDPPFNSNKKWQRPMEGKLQRDLDILIKAGADKDKDLYRRWSKYVDENKDDQDRLIMKFDDAWEYNEVKEEQKEEIRFKKPTVYQIIETVGASHSKKMKAYLIFMAVRLIEMHRILKPTGSLFLHCDPYANSYIRLILDAIFGIENMKNELIWCYSSPGNILRFFPRKHDTIFFYAKGDRWKFNADDVRIPHTDSSIKRYRAGKYKGWNENDQNTMKYIERGKLPFSWWNDIPRIWGTAKEKVGYPTQKPVALLKRIILACSDEGDIVFDPFCGCATAIEAAYLLGRNWIGCDLSFITVPLVKYRLQGNARAICTYKRNDVDPPVRDDYQEAVQPDFHSKLTHREREDIKEHYFGKQKGVCLGCGTHYDYKIFHLDHRKPRSKGGRDEKENLQLLCGSCNSRKGAKDERECMWMYKFSDEYQMAA